MGGEQALIAHPSAWGLGPDGPRKKMSLLSNALCQRTHVVTEKSLSIHQRRSIAVTRESPSLAAYAPTPSRYSTLKHAC